MVAALQGALVGDDAEGQRRAPMGAAIQQGLPCPVLPLKDHHLLSGDLQGLGIAGDFHQGQRRGPLAGEQGEQVRRRTSGLIFLFFQFQPAGCHQFVFALFGAQGIQHRHGFVPGLVVKTLGPGLAFQFVNLPFQPGNFLH